RPDIDIIIFGAMIGAGVQAITLATVLVRAGLVRLLPHEVPVVALREIASLALPILASLVIGQLALVVERVLASGLSTGTLASLNYSQKLVQLPASILVSAVATVILPYMSAQERGVSLLRQSLDGVYFVMAPAVAIVV